MRDGELLMKRILIAAIGAFLSLSAFAQIPSLGYNATPYDGLVIAGAENSSPVFPTTGDWNYIQSKNIKTVALTFAWENIQTATNSALSSTFVNNIKSALSAANSRGIGVVLRMQNYGHYANSTAWGSTVTTGGNGGVNAANVNYLGDGTLTSANFADVWTRIATALVGTPGLTGYDIMNEPVIPTWNTYGKNLYQAPGYFGATSAVIGGYSWYYFNSPTLTQLAAGTDPINANYQPAWTLTNTGAGYGAVSQYVVFANVAYTMSYYARSHSGTVPITLNIGGSNNCAATATTSWQRFTCTKTPPAGADNAYLQINSGTNGLAIDIADAQVEQAGSATAYESSPYLVHAQAAITAIRAVDATTPIYVQGWTFLYAGAGWAYYNWDMISLTGGNLIYEVHPYPDGPQGFGNGGSYSGSYSSYSINNQSAIAMIQNSFVAWLATTGAKGNIGEFNVPASDANWYDLAGRFLTYARSSNVPVFLEFYGANGAGSGTKLWVNPVSSNDDPRMTQMLAIH
jgi:hypothetical protein